MKHFATFCIGILLCCTPAVSYAEQTQDAYVIELYWRLIGVLKQEIAVLQHIQAVPSGASLTWEPVAGPAPFTTIFTVNGYSGTETIIFGDGTWNGSGGCTRNAGGFCDLSRPITHTYTTPGRYAVTLYSHLHHLPVQLSTQTITVTAASSSVQ